MFGYKKLTEEEEKALSIERKRESLEKEIHNLMVKRQELKDKQLQAKKELERL